MSDNVIILRGIENSNFIPREIEASGTVTPGMLLEYTSNSTVKAHSSTGGDAVPRFAVENDAMGKEISDDYSGGSKVKMALCQPGVEVYAKVTSGASTYSAGDLLESAGDGWLKAYTAPAFSGGDISGSEQTIYANAAVAQVVTTVTGSTGSTTRIKVEVI